MLTSVLTSELGIKDKEVMDELGIGCSDKEVDALIQALDGLRRVPASASRRSDTGIPRVPPGASRRSATGLPRVPAAASRSFRETQSSVSCARASETISSFSKGLQCVSQSIYFLGGIPVRGRTTAVHLYYM